MAEVIKMPRMSDTMTEGVIVAWHKKVGDKIKSGDLLAEIETDKAVMEFESFQDGTILYIGAEKGQSVKVDDVIAVLGKPGEDYKPALQNVSPSKLENGVEKKPEAVSEVKQTTSVSLPEVKSEKQVVEKETASDSRLKASPLAKKIAADSGVDLKNVKGSGDDGRIVKRDVEAALTEKPESKSVVQPVVLGKESFDEVPVSQMRKTIARRLAESKFSAPHFYLQMEINMDRAVEGREQMNKISEVKISFNDIVIKAAAMALRKNPKVNSSWLVDKIRYNHHIHIGMAVAVEEGLIVPVIKFADQKSISQISAEAKDLGKKAKDKKLQPVDWEGNTFTISNLGMFDIDNFTAIINPPDSCILAVGRIKLQPAIVDGQIKPCNILKVTLSCDHRVVDGATGASFLQTLKTMLESPLSMLL
jgi:pyruvate dehydrogenase E2 component (dihydrolipoamide acetyltransferase)